LAQVAHEFSLEVRHRSEDALDDLARRRLHDFLAAMLDQGAPWAFMQVFGQWHRLAAETRKVPGKLGLSPLTGRTKRHIQGMGRQSQACDPHQKTHPQVTL